MSSPSRIRWVAYSLAARHVVDSSGLGPARRFDAFFEAVSAQVVRVTPEPPHMGDFVARVISQHEGTRAAHLIEAPSHSARRGAAEIGSADPDELHLSYMLTGSRRVIVGDTDATIAAGDLFVHDTRAPFRLLSTVGRYRVVKLVFPRTEIVPPRGAVALRCPAPLAAHPLAHVLAATCACVGANLAGAHESSLRLLLGVGASLLAAVAGGEGMEGLGARPCEAFTLIDLEMDLALADPGFSLERLSRRVGLSARAIQRALAHRDVTFSDMLREKRLIHAHHRIATSAARLEQVAAESGYQEISAFYRAFRRRFGIAPGALRHAALR